MKKVIYLSAILLMLTACHDMRVSEKLNQIDSLIVKEQYDSAYIVLNDLNETAMTAEDQAHYRLLSTQLGFITNQPLPTDSLLDLAIVYYNKVGDDQKLADAYYYKSYRSEINGDYPQAIMYCKEAERLAMNTHNYRLKYKIIESLAYLNSFCGKNQLYLMYSKNALDIAKKIQNKSWMMYSYNNIGFAFYNLNQSDSAYYYIEKAIPYLKYVEEDKAVFFMNIGMLYKNANLKKAKFYLEKSISYDELPEAIEHLADVYYAEGKKDAAYKLWKKALSKNSKYEKDNLIHSILSYDLERGKLDEASKYVDEVIAIKDSIIYQLRNDTIKDLQLRFDHEVAMNEANERLIRWQWALGGIAFLLICLVGYILWRKHKSELQQASYEIQIRSKCNQIAELESSVAQAQNQISELRLAGSQDQQEISRLEQVRDKAQQEMQELVAKLEDFQGKEVTKIRRGIRLYDSVAKNEKAIKWTVEDYDAFIAFYETGHYNTMLKLHQKYGEITQRNMLYLILVDMGKTRDEICDIMSIDKSSIRSLIYRLNNPRKK